MRGNKTVLLIVDPGYADYVLAYAVDGQRITNIKEWNFGHFVTQIPLDSSYSVLSVCFDKK